MAAGPAASRSARVGETRPRIDIAPIAQHVVPRTVVLQGGWVAAVFGAVLDAVGPVQIRARPERVGRGAG